MGSGSFDHKAWKEYTTRSGYDTKPVDKIYSGRGLHPDLDPKGVIRESCDSADNPKSTPIIIGLDVTGSMIPVLDAVARSGINTLCTEILNRKPVTNPHVSIAGIGDLACDRVPFQVSQFEADLRIVEHLEKLYLECGGGGNDFESYAAAWYFAVHHTRCDSFAKRGVKGFIVTVGDELPTRTLGRARIAEVFGDELQADPDPVDVLTRAQREWHVLHCVIEQGSFARRNPLKVVEAWRQVLGQNVLPVSDHTKLAEVIVSAMQVIAGERPEDVAASWGGSTSMVVSSAVGSLRSTSEHGGAIVTL